MFFLHSKIIALASMLQPYNTDYCTAFINDIEPFSRVNCSVFTLQIIKDQHELCILLKSTPLPFVLQKGKQVFLEYPKHCAGWEVAHYGKSKVCIETYCYFVVFHLIYYSKFVS